MVILSSVFMSTSKLARGFELSDDVTSTSIDEGVNTNAQPSYKSLLFKNPPTVMKLYGALHSISMFLPFSRFPDTGISFILTSSLFWYDKTNILALVISFFTLSSILFLSLQIGEDNSIASSFLSFEVSIYMSLP